ncbi:hypothetical protein [Aggregatibacter actinomycetemcomitans]|uniref:hypothetical protein n=1 Tax=Aggregatibacter actinomycetemcomitans TaxID=714 RepID=UPI0011DD5EDB|nr:hypothetical protein [Aggregatibacter actinomycetemcomitans]QEH49188.1 hypothetical protein FXN57_05640 [Aggregatibacter actinomycetemcomitans]
MSFEVKRKEFHYKKIEYKYLENNINIDGIDTLCNIIDKEQVLKKHNVIDEVIFSGSWNITLTSNIFFADLEVDCILSVCVSEKRLLETKDQELLKNIQKESIKASMDYINDELNKFLKMTPFQPTKEVNFIEEYKK